MSIIGFFICIWYLAGGIALYHKIFMSGTELFGYLWTVLVLGLTKFYTDELFFWPKLDRKYTKLILHLSSITLLFLSFFAEELLLIPLFVGLYIFLFYKLHTAPFKDHNI
jgi:hypothetical protein